MRVAWELYYGPIPHGLCICHKCDKPACINPAHLFLGTHVDNAKDMNRKGRRASTRGTLNGKSKLTPKQVIEIRSSPLGLSALGRKFGVAPQSIDLIRKRKNWGWL
jgi:hypothetical protein